MDPLGFFCTVCGSPVERPLAETTGACRRCGAGWRTMELAGVLLGEVSRGCHIVLNRFARDPASQRCRILDLSFDPVIERELHCIPGYHKIVVRTGDSHEGSSSWQVPIDSAVPKRLPFKDKTKDAVIVRDLTRVVADPRQFVEECFRVVAPGGSVILQDRYRWPLPDETVENRGSAEPGSAAADTGGKAAVQVRELGANLLTELRNAGFIAYFERPAMSVDPLYRTGFAVGIKP